MLKIRNYLIIAVSVFAITSACALVGVKDVKAQEGPALTDLIKRIEALEAKPGGGGNVSAGILNSIDGIKIGFGVRHRFEIRDNMLLSAPGLGRVFNPADGNYTRFGTGGVGTGANNTTSGRSETNEFTLQRVRLDINANVNRNVFARVRLQDARTFGEEFNTVGNLQRTDVQEGYVELRNLGDLNPILNDITLRIGRWGQNYGNSRLIGSLEWANQGRAYDGAKLRWDNKKHWVDLFAFQINEKETGVADGGGRLSPGDSYQDIEEVLYGVYTHFKIYDGVAVEPYGIVRARSAEDTQPASSSASGVLRNTGEQRYTAGFRLVGKNIPELPGVDFTLEPAWQFGKVEGLRAGDYDRRNPAITSGQFDGNNISNTIQAFAIHAEVGYTFKNVPWTPRIGYAFSFASGDERSNQGAAKTFDHLYPTGHAHNGYMDMTGWQNIRDHQVHLNIKPTKKLVVDAKLHFMSLDEEADNLYGVAGGTGYGGGMQVWRSGADNYIDASGMHSVDNTLGQEIDLTVKYKLFKNFGVVAGYSHFFADDWVEDTGAGIDRGADWAYLMTNLVF